MITFLRWFKGIIVNHPSMNVDIPYKRASFCKKKWEKRKKEIYFIEKMVSFARKSEFLYSLGLASAECSSIGEDQSSCVAYIFSGLF